MEKAKIIALKESVLEDNDQDAQALREELHAGGTCLMNLMSSPGSGKTTTLLALNKAFDGRLRWGVMEADIDSAVDADTMLAAGVPSARWTPTPCSRQGCRLSSSIRAACATWTRT